MVESIRLYDLPNRCPEKLREFAKKWLGDDPWDKHLDGWAPDHVLLVPVERHGARMLFAAFLAHLYENACCIRCGSSLWANLTSEGRTAFVGLWSVVTPDDRHLYTDLDDQGAATGLPACRYIKAREGRRILDRFSRVRAEDFATEALSFLRGIAS
jgi:hypothetical protein